MIFIVSLLVLTSSYAAGPINEKNWINHPEVVEVRSLYKTIKEEKDAGKLKMIKRKFDYCEPYQDTLRSLFTDGNGKPRIYYYSGGSDDSAVHRELYYDDNGKLRFAFIVAGAYNGTKLEHRVYFSRKGVKVWEIQKLIDGPGYTFPDEWPEDELIKNPAQAYNEKSPCPEMK